MPDTSALRLEDRLVDTVAEEVANQTRASLLVAHAPRAMIDLNRATDEVDWSMVAGAKGQCKVVRPQGRRVRSGLGLVPRRLAGDGEIWRHPLTKEELDRRIAEIHEPYHQTLSDELTRLKQRWGAALLLDLHSMPPITQDVAPEFVLGDRFGASCSAALGAAVVECVQDHKSRIAQNRPYAGGYVLDRHSAPRRAIHAMQLEICRSAYLDGSLSEKGPGFDRIVEVITHIVQTLASEVAALGSAEAGRLAAE